MRLLLDVNVLVALAVAHGGTLATLDHRVALNAVRGAQAGHLRLL